MTEKYNLTARSIRSGGLTLAKSGPIETRFDPDSAELLPMVWTIANSTKLQDVVAANAGAVRAPAGTISFHAKLSQGAATAEKSAKKLHEKLSCKTERK